MHPTRTPVRPASDAPTDVARGRSPDRLGRAPAVAAALLAAAALLLAAVEPGAAAVVDTSWKASLGPSGANGAATVAALTTGTGTATLRLSSLPRSAPVAVAIRAGTCAKPGAIAAALPTTSSTAAGRISRVAALGRSSVAKMKAAGSLVMTVRSGSFALCAPLRLVRSPSASPSPSPTAIEIEAHQFAFAPATFSVPADVPVSVTFRNDDSGIPHGVDVGTGPGADPIAAAGVITGVATKSFTIPALAAGRYAIWCPVHPRMTATLLVGGVGAASPSASPSPTTVPQATAHPTEAPTPEPTTYGPPPTYDPY